MVVCYHVGFCNLCIFSLLAIWFLGHAYRVPWSVILSMSINVNVNECVVVSSHDTYITHHVTNIDDELLSGGVFMLVSVGF